MGIQESNSHIRTMKVELVIREDADSAEKFYTKKELIKTLKKLRGYGLEIIDVTSVAI